VPCSTVPGGSRGDRGSPVTPARPGQPRPGTDLVRPTTARSCCRHGRPRPSAAAAAGPPVACPSRHRGDQAAGGHDPPRRATACSARRSQPGQARTIYESTDTRVGVGAGQARASNTDTPIERSGPPLGKGVHLRRPERRAEHLPYLASHHVIEAAGELGVMVAFLACCVTRAESGCAMTPAARTSLELSWKKNARWSVPSRIALPRTSPHATTPSACARGCRLITPSGHPGSSMVNGTRSRTARQGPTLAVRAPPASSAPECLRSGPRAGCWCECPPDAAGRRSRRPRPVRRRRT
jgi:hypothetical protein